MSNVFLRTMCICVFSLSIPAAFAELPAFNRYPVTNNSLDDLPGKRFYLKVYEPEMAKTQISLYSHHKTLYYGELKVGSGDQTFKVLFDTGSRRTWIAGTKCSSIACSNKNRFDPLSSSSFKSSGHKMSIKYGSGKISGIIGYDDITVGGIKVASQGFGVANTVSYNFYRLPIDGVLGLDYKALNDSHITPWLDNAVQQGLIDKAIFSFYLSNTPKQNDSVMIIGKPDPSYYQGSVFWHNLTAIDNKHPESYHYSLSFDGISVGEKKFPLSCQTEQCKTLVDTGSTYIRGPRRDVESILEFLDVKPDCSNVSQLPPLKVSIDGHAYEVPPHIYVVKIPNCFGMIECVAGIRGKDVKYWTLGDSFLRAFYTVFDKANHRVGFARLHDRLNAPKTLRALY